MSDSGAAAARARVADLLERLARVQLQVVVVAPPDATRLAARDRARDAAIVAGRSALLEEATATARDMTLKAFARTGFSGTWAMTEMAVSVATAADRVAAAAAVEEAALAAIVEDLVEGETLGVLLSTWIKLAGSSGVPAPGSISSIGSGGVAISGPLQLASVAGFGMLLAVFGLLSLSFVTFVLGLAIVVGLGRRRRQPRVQTSSADAA